MANDIPMRSANASGPLSWIRDLPLWISALWVTGTLRADTHIYAGASTNAGDNRLAFTVANLFDVASGYRHPMVLRTNGLNAGHYRGDVLTFTALSATDIGTGQLPGRALLGARLAVQVVQVDGPAGGFFEFWEGDGENPGADVTFRDPVGTTGGSHSLVISENDGGPGSDPYGHIHGREFTTTVAGLYTVGFRLIDVSTNGPQGGPLHAPSDVFSMRFQAGPVIEAIQPVPTGVQLSFRTPLGITNLIEFKEGLQSPDWTPLAAPLRGNNKLQTVIDPQPSAAVRLYRLRVLNIPR